MLKRRVLLVSQTTMKKIILRRLNVSLTEEEKSNKLNSIVRTPLVWASVQNEAKFRFLSIKTTHEPSREKMRKSRLEHSRTLQVLLKRR